MAVNFTPNIGLAKPTDSELGKNWTRDQKLVEDNNILIVDRSKLLMTSYTPSIIAVTTNPNVGAGQIVGSYYEFQGFVIGDFNIRFVDPGISVGSGVGAYGISLPFPADASFYTISVSLTGAVAQYSCIGEGYYNDSSSVTSSGPTALDVLTIGGVGYVRMMTETYAGKTANWIGPNVPTTIANNDALSGSFFYKKA